MCNVVLINILEESAVSSYDSTYCSDHIAHYHTRLTFKLQALIVVALVLASCRSTATTLVIRTRLPLGETSTTAFFNPRSATGKAILLSEIAVVVGIRIATGFVIPRAACVPTRRSSG